MKKFGLLVIVFIILVVLIGCTTAGPFVTDVYSDGKGGLIVKKGYEELVCRWMGVIGDKSGEKTIKLLSDEKVK